MSLIPPNNQNPMVQYVTGNVIGFVRTFSECEAIRNALTRCGVAIERIRVIDPPHGFELFQRMMHGQAWGDNPEVMAKFEKQEISDRYFAFCVETKDREEGVHIARVAHSQGGHGFQHFGDWVDVRLPS